MTLTACVRQHPLSSYFALAFGISWGSILIVLGATDFNLVENRTLDTGLIFVSMLLGPSVAGLTMTAMLDGRQGLRRLGSQAARYRVGLRWYLVALMTIPLLLLATLVPLSVFVDPAFAPQFQWRLFAIGLVAGSFEEVGWTGFAAPRLLARHRLFISGLFLGLVWALWHVLVDFRQNFNILGAAWLLEFALFYVAALTAYRLLMTWVYANTHSLLLAVLMHASYTGWLLVLYPKASAEQGAVWQTAFAAASWVVVATVTVARMRRR
jgi:membrane protease YdiL (CAAX protease family)